MISVDLYLTCQVKFELCGLGILTGGRIDCNVCNVGLAVFYQNASGFQTRSRSRSRSPARRRSRSRSPARTTRRSSSRTAAAVAAAAITESAPPSRRDARLKDTLEVRLSPLVSATATWYYVPPE